MPHITEIIKTAAIPHAAALLFIAGIILAGSDGPHFPMLNAVGVGCLGGCAWLARGYA